MTTPTPTPPIRPSVLLRAVDKVAGVALHVVVGLFLIAAGSAWAAYILTHPAVTQKFVWIGVGGVILGFLFLPDGVTIFRSVTTTVFPNGVTVPVIGKVGGGPPPPPGTP